MKDIRQRLLEAFAAEHREHLEAVRGMLGMLTDSAKGAGSVDLSEMHRRLHSLKGAARATDLKPIENLAHRLESLAASVQSGNVSLGPEAVKIIKTGLDGIEDWFAAYVKGETPPSLDAMITEAESASGTQVQNRAKPPADKPPSRTPTAETTHPVPDGARADKRADTPRDSVRVDVEALDRLLVRANEIMLSEDGLRSIDEEENRLSARIERLTWLLDRPGTAHAAKSALAPENSGSQMFSELTAELRALSNDVRGVMGRQREAAWRSRQLTKSLHREAQQVRMVSADSVYGGLRKMVRDIAADEGKQVDIEIAGGATRADRMVLQELKDPLIQILRNAIGHGIEPPAERINGGKPETALIRVDISAHAGKLKLSVTDDGRGLDLAAISRKARSAGYLGKDDADLKNHKQAQDILMHAGFTTTESVTSLSGRGMGMSVAQRVAARLQGSLTLSPAESGGLVVCIEVPLSVATTKLLVVQSGVHTVAIPTSMVERLHKVRQDALGNVDGSVVFVPKDKGGSVSVFSLADLFGGTAAELDEGELVTLVCIRSGSGPMAMTVDRVLEVKEFIVEDLSHILPEGELVCGAIMFGGARVVCVLNPAGIAARSRRNGDALMQRPRQPRERKKIPSILVVDDSITTRTLEKGILEANGFRVRLSVDGLDALEQLRSEPIDLIVSDVEMPRMDGFDLLRAIKRDAVLGKTPVVLVTSRDNAEDRARGLELGADAYVVKQRFDQTDLLETIRQLL